MPYYRIVVWTRNRTRPFQGIREIGNSNITAVFGMVKKKAEDTFHSNLVDVEVQRLPKTCTAIQNIWKEK